MNLSLSDGFLFELGRMFAGVAIVLAVIVACMALAVYQTLRERRKDRLGREAGCQVCHKKATRYQSYNGRKGYMCSNHTLAPADHAHGFSVPLTK